MQPAFRPAVTWAPVRRLAQFLRFASFVVGGLLGVLVVVTLAERAVWRGKVLPGVRLAGVSVGGDGLQEARRAIAERARALEENPLVAVAGDERFTFTPADVGLELDEEEALEQVVRAGRAESLAAQAVGVITRRVSPLEVRWRSRYDDAKLARTVDRWAGRFDTAPVNGTVRVEGSAVTPVPPRPGRILPQEEARELVRAALHGRVRSPVHLPVETVAPRVGTAEVERAAAEARRVVAGPATVEVSGRRLTLAAATLGDAVTVTTDGGRLRLDLPAAAVHEALRPGLEGLEVPPVDARFVIDHEPPPSGVAGGGMGPPPTTTTTTTTTAATTASSPPPPAGGEAEPATAPPPPAPPADAAPPPPPTVRIEPSIPGRTLDAGPVAAALLAGARHVVGHLVDVAPRIDTARAETLRIIEPVSSFTTRHPAGQSRVRNIHRIADLLQNRLILPGERFSLNQAVGPRTRAAGFVTAPVIYNGKFTQDVGGGVSQFATTFFNAAFFGGYEIVSHKPHSYYISRYPKGREATISFPQPDLVIANDTSSGILVRTAYTESSITVTFWGDREGRTVRAEGPRVGGRQRNGYSVTVVRVIERSGHPPERQTFRTFYRYRSRAGTAD